MISAAIMSLSQDMDLETGSMANFLVLKLPNGRSFRALVADEAAQQVVQLFVGGAGGDVETGAPPEKYVATAVVTPEAPEPLVFGGAPDPALPARRPPVTRVASDQFGYPVVESAGGVDPSSFLDDRDPDEDGVGQI